MTLTTIVTILAYDYLRRIGGAQTNAGLFAGIVWLAISVLIDLPFMLSSFVGMSLDEHLADIGLTYLLIPAITTGMGMAFAHADRKAG